jgi:hypothetical protein
MSPLSVYWYCVAGVATSVILPILLEAVKRFFPAKAGPASLGVIRKAFWKVVKPYLVLGAFSGLTALLLIAFAGNSVDDWRAAFLLGYAWDSTLQRLANK